MALKKHMSSLWNNHENLKNISEAILACCKIIAIAFFLVIALRVFTEYRKDTLIIKQFDTPDDLVKQGYNGAVIAQMLLDEIKIAQRKGQEFAVERVMKGFVGIGEMWSDRWNKRVIQTANAEKSQEISVPGVGISLNTTVVRILNLLKIRNFQSYVGGYIITKEKFSITVNISEKYSKTFESNMGDINQAVKEVALYIAGMKQPLAIGLDYCFNPDKEPLKSLKRQLLESNPSPEEKAIVYVLDGCALEQIGKLEEAQKRFEKAMEITPKNASVRSVALYMMGDIQRENGQFTKAIAKYKEALRWDPDNAGIYTRWAYALVLQGRFAEAKKKYKAALEKEKEDAWIYTVWGKALDIKPEEAKEKFAKAVEEAPNHIPAYINWGYLLLQLNDLKAAREKFTKAVEWEPKNAWAYIGWGEMLRDLNEPEAALAQYQQAVKVAPKNADAYIAIGNTLRSLHQPKEALAHYQKAVAMAPGNVWAYLGWGDTLWSLHQPKEALAHYQKAVEVAPSNVWAYLGWGNVLRDLHRPEEAREKYIKVRELDSDGPIGRQALEAIQQLQGLAEPKVQ
jgi:tetratricopeptide (TPR) repeat protein